MKVLNFFIISVCLLITIVNANEDNDEAKVREWFRQSKQYRNRYPQQTMFLVGTADRKGFFADNTKMMNWATADAYCKAAKMELVSITSEAQAQMLNNSYSSGDFSGAFWTSGKDVLDLKQFSWRSGAQPDPSFLEYDLHNGPATCLFYYSKDGQSTVRSNLCSTTARPFCEISVSRMIN